MKLINNAEVILLYDPIPLLSYRIASFFLKKPRILWYHNHDIMEIAKQRRYSISWWASKNEPSMFPKLDIFSLPAEERKAFFPIDKLGGRYIFLPNFPSLRRYSALQPSQKNKTEWRIIFQGSIGPGHGIEEICHLLPMKYEGQPVKLLLKGFVSNEFRNRVHTILEGRGAMDSVEWLGVTSYEVLAPLTASCHLGIAIFTGKDVMNRTLGTASNKIYEYMASGVPIIYYDNDYYAKYLGDYHWSVSTDLNTNNLIEAIFKAFAYHTEYSKIARTDFINYLNFDHYFSKLSPLIDNRKKIQTKD